MRTPFPSGSQPDELAACGASDGATTERRGSRGASRPGSTSAEGAFEGHRGRQLREQGVRRRRAAPGITCTRISFDEAEREPLLHHGRTVQADDLDRPSDLLWPARSRCGQPSGEFWNDSCGGAAVGRQSRSAAPPSTPRPSRRTRCGPRARRPAGTHSTRTDPRPVRRRIEFVAEPAPADEYTRDVRACPSASHVRLRTRRAARWPRSRGSRRPRLQMGQVRNVIGRTQSIRDTGARHRA